MSEPWALADRISDRIIDLLNEEKQKPGFSPVLALAGQMLAMFSFMSTAPQRSKPDEFIEAEEAIQRCLDSLLHHFKGIDQDHPAGRTSKPARRLS
jgi:hypothetical protein